MGAGHLRAGRLGVLVTECDTCGEEPILGEFAMPGVPISFAYCQECVTSNAHPYFAIVSNTAACGGLSKTAFFWRQMVKATLHRVDVSPEQFEADVQHKISDLRRMWEPIEEGP